MAKVRLVVFDVDGTLVDSLAHISQAMVSSFDQHGLAVPSNDDIRSIIGLSLPQAMENLLPEQDQDVYELLTETYKEFFVASVSDQHKTESPLFPGVHRLLDELLEDERIVLGIATGKSRRGLSRILEFYNLSGYFSTAHVADDHPSKPHPSMLYAAMKDTGIAPENCVIVGDTSFDMDMGKAAGFKTIGVSWGYHSPEVIKPLSDIYVSTPSDIKTSLTKIWMPSCD